MTRPEVEPGHWLRLREVEHSVAEAEDGWGVDLVRGVLLGGADLV